MKHGLKSAKISGKYRDLKLSQMWYWMWNLNLKIELRIQTIANCPDKNLLLLCMTSLIAKETLPFGVDFVFKLF